MTEGWILTPFPDQQAYPALVSSLSGDFPETFSFCASTSSLLVWSSVVLWNFREKKLLLSVANFWLWGKKEFSIPLPQCEALWYVSTALIYLTCFGVHAEWMSFVFQIPWPFGLRAYLQRVQVIEPFFLATPWTFILSQGLWWQQGRVSFCYTKGHEVKPWRKRKRVLICYINSTIFKGTICHRFLIPNLSLIMHPINQMSCHCVNASWWAHSLIVCLHLYPLFAAQAYLKHVSSEIRN